MYLYLKGGKLIDRRTNILIEEPYIKEISDKDISPLPPNCETIDCNGLTILPGVIDAHVHFRQPGAEHKGTMDSESKAALCGGVTSVFDMPNNSPAITTPELLEQKYELCAKNMCCNYALYFGLTNNNIEQAVKLDKTTIAGLKLFLGSSTGNMLVDNKNNIESLFKNSPHIITAHCEDEALIQENAKKYSGQEELPCDIHSLIRNEQVCYKSSNYAIALAKKYHSNFHLAHVSTAKEISLLDNRDLKDKTITAEVSANHLFFSSEDYALKGNLIKCNPSIKSTNDRQALRQALKEGYIDMIASDHAPHLLQEKQNNYFKSPSGIPSIEFSLLMMMQIAKQENWPLSLIAEKMSLNPALRFGIKQRGEVRKGYFADLVIVKEGQKYTVEKKKIHSLCNWSPLEGYRFDNTLIMTILNGRIVVKNGQLEGPCQGQKLFFS